MDLPFIHCCSHIVLFFASSLAISRFGSVPSLYDRFHDFQKKKICLLLAAPWQLLPLRK
jgi:hypothetical protein